ncbi:hypothetical protein LXL04_028805 [Taraxacum kok-saghyz]
MRMAPDSSTNHFALSTRNSSNGEILDICATPFSRAPEPQQITIRNYRSSDTIISSAEVKSLLLGSVQGGMNSLRLMDSLDEKSREREKEGCRASIVRLGPKDAIGCTLGIFRKAYHGELWSAPGAPSHFRNGNLALLQSLDFSVHDLHQFFHKVEFLVDLDLFKRYDKCFISQTLLEVRHMKGVMYVLQILW